MNQHTTAGKIISLTKLAFKIGITLLLSYWFFVGLLTPVIGQSPSAAPTESIGDLIKEKVAANKSNRKAAYVGEVTDKTDKTLSVTTRTGPKQVSFDADTTIVNQKAGANKKIKADDLAIGDFILAMGNLETGNNGVLSAKRIVVIDKPKPLQKTSINGLVTAADKSTLTVETNSRGEWQVKLAPDTLRIIPLR